MIGKLKRKFILLSLTALVLLLAFIVSGILFLNYRSLVGEADQVLAVLSGNEGTFPDPGEALYWLPHGMSPELPYESRFFSVLVNAQGWVLAAETSSIAAVDAQTALEYAAEALGRRADKGFVEDFRYVRVSESGLTRVTFLDCGRKLATAKDFAVYTLAMSLAGFLLIAGAVVVLSGRVTRPAAESVEKQKRFITDAGHELKTPLTIISANVDVLRMDLGENQCLTDIQQQTRRLTELTGELVYLSKLEETEEKPRMIDFPVSEVAADAAAAFKPVASAKGLDYAYVIEPMLTMNGNDRAVSQLISILLDNAMKYAPEGGHVELRLEKQGRRLVLTVTNPSAAPLEPGELRHVFERFYRPDASRSSETGGYGIGLSVAEAIVSVHNGRISASSPDGVTFRITAVFPG